MTKLEVFAKNTGLKLVATTTVWNVHSVCLADVAKKKGSNLNGEFKALAKQGKTGGFTLVVGCIGRSQHSATEVGIFEGVIEESYDYEEIFLNEPNAKFFN